MPRLKLLLLLVLWFTGLGTFALAQPSEGIDLAGRAIDRSGQPLDRVSISLLGPGDQILQVESDEQGRFGFADLIPGEYQVTAFKTGFLILERSLTLPQSESNGLEITMVPDAALVLKDRVMVIGDPAGLGDIPGSAHFIGVEQLNALKSDVDDIHQVLRRIPGINIQEEEGYGLRPNIGMRGSGLERNSKITVMEDGVLIAPAPYAAPSAYYFPTTGRMESVEVRKGSSQIKSGPRTNGGSLNLISSSIPSSKWSVDGNLVGGEDDFKKLLLTAGGSSEHVGWMAQTYQLRTDGFKRLDSGGNTGFDLEDYLFKLRLNTSADAAIYQQLEVKFGKTEQFGRETYLGLTDADFRANPLRRYAGSQRDFIDTDHKQYQARYFIAPSQRLDFTITAYRNDFARNWFKLQSVGGTNISAIFDDEAAFADELDILRGTVDSEADALKVRANNRSYYSYGVQAVAGLKANSGFLTHQFEMGLRYHRDAEDRLQHEDGFAMIDGRLEQSSSGAPGSQSNRLSKARAWAFFVQDEIKWRRLTLSPGVRYENIDLIRSDFSKSDPQRTQGSTRDRVNGLQVVIPGLGAHFEVNRSWSLFGGVHKGFSPPGPGSKEETQSEESVNWEGGFRFRQGGTHLQATAFFNDYENLLGADTLASGGTGEGDVFNGGKARVRGLEFSTGFDLGDSLGSRFKIPFNLAYTLTQGEFRTSFDSDFAPWGNVRVGDEIPYIPRNQLFIGWGFGQRDWRLRADTVYVGRMRTKAGQGSIDPRNATDSYWTLSLTGEYDLRREDSKWTFFLSARNLTDQAYIAARRPAGARPGLPRTITAGVRFHIGR